MNSVIISQLYQDTKIRIIGANQKAPRPQLPFGTFNVTSPYISESNRPNEWMEGDTLNWSKQYQQIVSFNFYGTTIEESIGKANEVRHWFLFFGRQFIETQNMAVLEITNIEDRTVFLEDSYDYKVGFDVRIRLSELLTQTVEWIETVN
jgi:hypothetical protein